MKNSNKHLVKTQQKLSNIPKIRIVSVIDRPTKRNHQLNEDLPKPTLRHY